MAYVTMAYVTVIVLFITFHVLCNLTQCCYMLYVYCNSVGVTMLVDISNKTGSVP